MSEIERIRAAAQVSVGRATMFGALAIWAASFGFISWPLTAFRLAALLSTLTMVILIYKAVQALSDVQAAEVLDFIYSLRTRQELVEHRDLQAAQQDAMYHVWDNPEDEVWNHA